MRPLTAAVVNVCAHQHLYEGSAASMMSGLYYFKVPCFALPGSYSLAFRLLGEKNSRCVAPYNHAEPLIHPLKLIEKRWALLRSSSISIRPLSSCRYPVRVTEHPLCRTPSTHPCHRIPTLHLSVRVKLEEDKSRPPSRAGGSSSQVITQHGAL
jgi:hypothetical protein